MTDHDRGAYTPQPDAPLQFDARGPRGRKPMPMTLIGSGAVLVVVLGALAMHYRAGSAKGDGVRPVGEPVAQVKAAAPASAQPKDASGGVDVLNTPGAVAQNSVKAPTFVAPPEQPKPRSQLTVQTDEAVAPVKPLPTTNTTAPAPVAVAKVAPLKPAPVTVAKVPAYRAPGTALATAKPDAAVVAAKPVTLAAAKPVVAKPATLATAKTTTAKAQAGGAVVQIGAFSSTTQSDNGYTAVASAMSGEMGGKTKRIETVEKDGKTYFRTSVAGFSSRAAADAFCKSLAAKGRSCFAKG